MTQETKEEFDNFLAAIETLVYGVSSFVGQMTVAEVTTAARKLRLAIEKEPEE